MKIQVQNVNEPDIKNHSHARVLHGDRWSDHDILIWEETPGYIPLRVEGFERWYRYTNTFGFSTFICKSFDNGE